MTKTIFTETIVMAAILINGKVVSINPPGRHSDIIRMYGEGVGGKRRRYPQGFWDDEIFEVTCPDEGTPHDHRACRKQAEEELTTWARRWFRSSVWTLDEIETIELKLGDVETIELAP